MRQLLVGGENDEGTVRRPTSRLGKSARAQGVAFGLVDAVGDGVFDVEVCWSADHRSAGREDPHEPYARDFGDG